VLKDGLSHLHVEGKLLNIEEKEIWSYDLGYAKQEMNIAIWSTP